MNTALSDILEAYAETEGCACCRSKDAAAEAIRALCRVVAEQDREEPAHMSWLEWQTPEGQAMRRAAALKRARIAERHLLQALPAHTVFHLKRDRGYAEKETLSEDGTWLSEYDDEGTPKVFNWPEAFAAQNDLKSTDDGFFFPFTPEQETD